MVDLDITEKDLHTEWYLTGRKNQLLKELSECVGDKEILAVARELKKVVSELQTKYGKSEEKKYKYGVCLSAEDYSDGYVRLTKREAEIVSYATNERNWENKTSNPYSGSFYIDLEHPVEIVEFPINEIREFFD